MTQNLKALKRAPQGTLAFRLYLLIMSGISHVYNPFWSTVDKKLERVKKGLMSELLTGRKRVMA